MEHELHKWEVFPQWKQNGFSGKPSESISFFFEAKHFNVVAFSSSVKGWEDKYVLSFLLKLETGLTWSIFERFEEEVVEEVVEEANEVDVS